MVDVFNSTFGRIIEAALYPFRNLSPWIALAAVSLVTAVLMLLVYRLTSNRTRIRLIKDRIIAHLLEIRLYRHNLPATFRAQGNILWWNLKYFGHSARPMLVMIVPLALALLQLDLWFGYEPLKPGESAIVKVRLNEGYRPSRVAFELAPSPGIVAETPPLRIDSANEVDWRLGAREAGVQELTIRADGRAVAKKIVVGDGSLARISPARVAPDWFDQLANPGEAAIPQPSPVREIEIEFPARVMNILGWRVHWLVAYFALCIAFGFALKRPFRVEL